MKIVITMLCTALVGGLALAPAVGQEKKTPPAAGAPQGMPAMPKAGPEHEMLKMDEGEWTATVEVWMVPGQPPSTSMGVETNRLGCGGMCLVTDFKGESMGQPFHGHGVAAWDSLKKKYVSTWTDSMSIGMMTGESTWSAATKTMAGWMEGPDAMVGKVTKSRSTVEYMDADTRVFTMYNTAPGGKETMGMRITYKRKK